MISRKTLIVTALIILLISAIPAFGWMGNGWGHDNGYSRGSTAAAMSLSNEQQKQIEAVQNKYQPQIHELQQRLDTKSTELAKARANGSTTVAQLNTLETDLSQLERQYWSLIDKTNTEVAGVAGTGFGPYFTCAYTGCNHQHRTRAAMVPGPQMNCCW